jgi:predicted amidohydrolase YtcJ
VSGLVLRDVEVGGDPADVVVRDGIVVAVDRDRAVRSPDADEVVDGRGGALLPGLHDHHLHLAAMAAARSSVQLDRLGADDASAMSAALSGASPTAQGWLRATGYHEHIAGELDCDALDRMVGERRVRVQHRTGAMWVLSSAAARAVDLDRGDHPGIERDAGGRPTGRLFGADSWLRPRLPVEPPPDLSAVGTEVAAYGVTGVTDATPTDALADLELLAGAAARGDLPLDVVVTGGVALADITAPSPLRLGPVKVVVADHALPALDDLRVAIERAHAQGRSVAIHCVTHVATVLALTAWGDAGAAPGDRIEHGAVITPDTAAIVARHGLTVVTQPSFVRERGDDYLRDVDPEDRPYLYRCASLEAAGIPVGGSTDAPYASADPWQAIATATDRRTRSGAALGPGEAVTPRRALELFLGAPEAPGGPPRRVEVGAPGDLCLLDVPLSEALAEPDAHHVRTTLRSGEVTFAS